MTSLWNALPYFSADDEIMIMVMMTVTRSCIASGAGEGSGGRQGCFIESTSVKELEVIVPG